MDAKDILGLPKTPFAITQEKKSRPQEDSQRKPHGISRKVYALTGSLALLIRSIDVSQLKKCPPSDEKITWQWFPLTNSARMDNLQLYHLVRMVNGIPSTNRNSYNIRRQRVYLSFRVPMAICRTPPKVGDLDQAFVPDFISFGGEWVGKRDQKRKGPERASETPSPAHKRPRKLRASDL
ncbi:hypothetical protein SLA2020_373710 [Shorea laevis]